MSIKLKNLINTEYKSQSNKPLIAESFWSKLKSLFGPTKKDKFSKLKKDKKFLDSIKGINKHWSNISKMIEKDYGQKVKFNKFTADDFK